MGKYWNYINRSKYWNYMIGCLLLGGFGIHEFYVKNDLGGILSILFCWTYIPCVVALIKFIVWLSRGEDEWNAKYLAVVESGTTGSKSNTTDSSEDNNRIILSDVDAEHREEVSKKRSVNDNKKNEN